MNFAFDSEQYRGLWLLKQSSLGKVEGYFKLFSWHVSMTVDLVIFVLAKLNAALPATKTFCPSRDFKMTSRVE